MPKVKKVQGEKQVLTPVKEQGENAVAVRGDQAVVPAKELGPEGLIALAIEKGVNVDSLERLLGMRRELKEERAREIFHESLARFQASCPPIEKIKQVNDRNGKPRYRYAPLEHIIETVKYSLMQNGFSYSFDTVYEAAPPAQKVTCTLTHISGHRETSTFRSPVDPDAYMNETQKVASALTYGKRYTFVGVTGVVTADEDDDAHSCGPEEVPSHGGYNPPEKNSPKQTADVPEKHEYGPKEKKVLKEIGDILDHPSFPGYIAKEAKQLLAGKMYRIETLLKIKDRALVQLDKAEILKAEAEEAKEGTLEEAKVLGDDELSGQPFNKPLPEALKNGTAKSD